MTIWARAYILATLAAGALLFAVHLPRLSVSDPVLLLAACGLASLTQILKVEGATSKTSYNISWMVFAFTFILFGAPATVLVILVAHLAEWIWHKYPWYVQTFNIASYALALQAAQWALSWSPSIEIPLNLATAAALVGALAVFTLANHLLVGLVIWMARGENFVQSGVFALLTLMIDFSLLCLGVAAALIWLLNPYAMIVTVVPLYLIYSTLRVPALERQTDTDAKTGLFNMRYLTRALHREVDRARRLGSPLTVVTADLDLLRNINNTYGHLAGDVVLLGIAQLLQKSVRAYDVVARFGGEEFTILMPEIAPEQVAAHIEAMRAAVEAAEFEVATSVTPIKATMSFGVAGLEQGSQSAEDLLHNADVALYHSKLAGRNRVSLYSAKGVEDLFGRVRPGEAPAPALLPAIPSPQKASPPSPQPPSTQPAQAPAKRARGAVGRPAWMIKAYVLGVALVAAAGLALALGRGAAPDWIGLGMFAVIVILAEWLALDIYVRDTSVSIAAVPLIAGALLFGPWGALVLSLALAATAKIKHKSSLDRFLFNSSNHLLSSLLAVGLYRLAGATLTSVPTWALLAVCLVAAGLTFASSTWLIALAIDLDTGQSARRVWAERFSWLAPSYLAMGLVMFVLAFTYLQFGHLGVASAVLPLGIVRYSQKQYVERTRTIVAELRATNAELLQQSREVSTLSEELLLALAHVVDMRDPFVMGHSHHVARYAVRIAQELGLSKEEVEIVRKASLLHDIGKLGVPEAILFKPGPLTAEEFRLVQRHVLLGVELMRDSRSFHRLIPIVRHHHEHFDGQGYPDGLAGTQIPLAARIVALADAVEAMASDRPYRMGLERLAIMLELQANAGAQFDPVVVEAFHRVVEKEGLGLIVNSARNLPLSREWAEGVHVATLGALPLNHFTRQAYFGT